MLKSKSIVLLKFITYKRLIFLLSLLLVSCSLVTTKIFNSSSLFNYYAVIILSSIIFVLFLIFKLFKFVSITHTQINMPFAFFLFLAWIFNVFINYQEYNHYVNYRVALGLLFVLSYFLLKDKNVKSFYIAVISISTIESVWCFLQWFGFMGSESDFFRITGSQTNPNITAMFLAISIPAVFYLIFKSKHIIRLIYIILAFVLFSAIVLLKCRTALIGSIISCCVFLCFHYDVFRRFQKRYVIAVTLIAFIISVPIGRQLYLLKEASAEGRILVWNTSLNMILDAPLKGYGVGLFSKEYNLKQAELIKQNQLDEDQIKNATYVKTAYNDYIEQGVDAGIPGMVLFVAMIFFLLSLRPNKTYGIESFYASYSAIVAASVMMLFNFVVNAMPVILLFALYAGIACNSSKNQYFFRLRAKRIYTTYFIVILIVFLGVFLAFQLNFASAHLRFKKAQILVSKNHIAEAETQFKLINETLQSSTSFLINYGNLCFMQKDYKKSLEKFNSAKELSSDPQIFDMISKCYYYLNNYKLAIYNMDMATRLHPKKMEYKYGLLRLFYMDNQINKAEGVAFSIVNMVPINTNEMTEKYQSEARLFLERFRDDKNN